MTITTGDIIKLTLEYAMPGAGVCMNVFHYAYLGSDQADQDIIDRIMTWVTDEWGDTWQNIAATTATLANAVFETVDVDGHILRALGTEVVDLDGLNGAEVLPAANAAYIQANTATPGVFGRKYVPGMSETATSEGFVTAATAAQMAILLLQYMDTLNVSAGNNLFPVVRSLKLLGFPRLVTAGVINLLPAYQRRRKQGVGI